MRKGTSCPTVQRLAMMRPRSRLNQVGDGEAGHGDFDGEQARKRFDAQPSIGQGIGDSSLGFELSGGGH